MDFKKKENEIIRFQKKEYKGSYFFDIRSYFKAEDGDDYLATKRGITVPTDKIQEFASAINEFFKKENIK